MPALVAGIHVFTIVKTGKDVDGTRKSGLPDLRIK
jgi:hypothetical protein